MVDITKMRILLAGSIICLLGCIGCGKQQDILSQEPVIPLVEDTAGELNTVQNADEKDTADEDGNADKTVTAAAERIAGSDNNTNEAEANTSAAAKEFADLTVTAILEHSDTDVVEIVSTQLSESELASFSTYFNEEEVNGFLADSFELPAQLKLSTVLQSISSTGNSLSEKEYAEARAVLNADAAITASEQAGFGQNGLHKADIVKYPSSYVEELLHKYTGLGLSDLTQNRDCAYSSTYDAYYMKKSDTGVQKITCTAGSVDDAGLYSIFYKKEGEDGLWNVILRENADSRLFHSNTKISGE